MSLVEAYDAFTTWLSDGISRIDGPTFFLAAAATLMCFMLYLALTVDDEHPDD